MAIRRSHAVDVGGWRYPTHTGFLAPESDFVARISDVAGPPRWIPRITCIKLSAAERHNVYRTKPTNEQAHWQAQIRAAVDPEHAIGEHAGRPYRLAGRRSGRRALNVASFRLRHWLGLSTQIDAQTALRRERRFKGLR